MLSRKLEPTSRAKLPDIRPNDLKTVPSVADTLELSRSDDGSDGKDNDGKDGKDAHEEDVVQIDIASLDPSLGHIG